ncbi:MAG TPA: hypothetical protein VJP85_06995 [Candidatus Baltobacteraceae bacterium]|nr:hypothetical protein [Candidatus Baltobacteraceae bacterium]
MVVTETDTDWLWPLLSVAASVQLPAPTAVTVIVALGPSALEGDAVAIPLHLEASTVKLPL